MNGIEKTAKKLNNELKSTYGGTRDYYLALAYLMQEFGIEQSKALNQIAFNQPAYGINAFHFDKESRNFYLFIISWSSKTNQINSALHQFIDTAMEKIFFFKKDSGNTDIFYNQITSCLQENNALVVQLHLRILFAGPLHDLMSNKSINDLLFVMDQRKYIIDRVFRGRFLRFLFDQRSIMDI